MDRRVDTREIIISVFSVAIKVVLIVVAAMFIYKYAMIGYDYGYRIFGEEPMSSGEGRKVSVTVGTDMSVKDIGQTLENKGLIRDAKLFVIQERLSEYHGTIVPGIYELSTAMTAEQMIAVMSSEAQAEGAGEGSDTSSAPVSDTAVNPMSEQEEYYIDSEDMPDADTVVDDGSAGVDATGDTVQ